jgi:hypothetical protein
MRAVGHMGCTAQHPGRIFSTSPQQLAHMRISKSTEENHTHFDPHSLQQVQTWLNGTSTSELAHQRMEWKQANVFADDLYPNTTVRVGCAEPLYVTATVS